jgi:hypothetical protein
MIGRPNWQVGAVSHPQFTAHFSTFEAAVADRYVVESEIGRGNRATVYRGWMVAHHQPVAIKVLRADLASALDSHRFLKQMRKAADIRHPGIISFIDAGEAAGRLLCVPRISKVRRSGRGSLASACCRCPLRSPSPARSPMHSGTHTRTMSCTRT